MPDLNKTRELLETEFINGWSDTTPIKFDNISFVDKNIESFVEMRFINYTTNNVNIGGALNKRERHVGVLSIKIFIKQDKGSGLAYEYADQIRLFMSNFQKQNLFTGSSETRRVGENEGGWFVLIVDVPYTSDET